MLKAEDYEPHETFLEHASKADVNKLNANNG